MNDVHTHETDTTDEPRWRRWITAAVATMAVLFGVFAGIYLSHGEWIKAVIAVAFAGYALYLVLGRCDCQDREPRQPEGGWS